MTGLNSRQIDNLISRRERIVEVFSVLANASRLHIISLLLNNEMMVGAITEAVGAGPTAVSHHLSKLRRAGIVTFRKEGQFIYYSVSPETARRFYPAFALFAEDMKQIGEQDGIAVMACALTLT
ncbi:metalloregulator ArsR/SmtB family transcription factor [Ochrobactrum sp. GPK 3]|uniref:ArsR/SmtB family transcription factor n=1 Tax=Brucella sp. 22210 TaxID=3453892 RepID=UPI0031385C6C